MTKSKLAYIISASVPATMFAGTAPIKSATPSEGAAPVQQQVPLRADTLRYMHPAVVQATAKNLNVDSLKSELQRQVIARNGKHYGCSAISLTALAATFGTPYTEQQLRSLSEAFSGGIGHKFTNGTCGALSGAVMAIGMYASGDKTKHQALAAEVYDALQQQEGGIQCGDIYGKHKFSHCDGCIRCVTEKVVEVLLREGDITLPAATPWQDSLPVAQWQKSE